MLKLLCCFFLILSMSAPAFGGMLAFTATGNITTAVDTFRAVLGDPNNGNNAGPLASGRREINWDGGGVPFDMPFDFFKNGRGVSFSTPGTGFGVSNSAVPADNEFDTFNPSYPDEFTTFSSPRLFTPIGSNVMDVSFFIPGSSTPAAVAGFGAVFTDVDLPDTTQLVFFNQEANILGSIYVPVLDKGLSFAGGFFDAGEKIFRVRITSGNSALGPNDAPDPSHNIDIVVMDDFLYSEPVSAVPLPGSLLLLSSGLMSLAGWVRLRSK